MIALFALPLVLACQEPEATEPFTPLEFLTEESTGTRYYSAFVEGASHVCLVAGVKFGFDHDPAGRTGLARTVATTLRIHFAQAPRRELGVAVRTIGPGTVMAATVPADAARRVLGEFAEVLDGDFAVSDDLAARAVSQVKLRCDDETELLPGPVLYWRARRAMLVGDPRGRQAPGIPGELETLSAAEIEATIERHFAPAHAFVTAVGATDDVTLATDIATTFSPPRDGTVAADPMSHDTAKPTEDITEHGLVDAPFVSAALRAKSWGDPGYLPFVVAMGIVRARAARSFQPFRGGEAKARFEFVNYSYLDEPGVVMINRRGRNGDSVERVQQEIRGLLADLREHGATSTEIGYAIHEVSQSLSLPPYGSNFARIAARSPQALYPRAWVLALYEVFEWPADLPQLFSKTTVGQVSKEFETALAVDRVRWFALRPDPDRAPSKGR